MTKKQSESLSKALFLWTNAKTKYGWCSCRLGLSSQRWRFRNCQFVLYNERREGTRSSPRASNHKVWLHSLVWIWCLCCVVAQAGYSCWAIHTSVTENILQRQFETTTTTTELVTFQVTAIIYVHVEDAPHRAKLITSTELESMWNTAGEGGGNF